MEITKKDFESYKRVRDSGVTNIFDIKTVAELSGLEKKTILEIMKNFSVLEKKYT